MALYSSHHEHYPTHLQEVHIALFTDVSNAAELRSRIIKAATIEGAEGDAAKEEVNFAFIDARLITSILHLRTAIAQAVLADVQGALRTKTIHSEILWALNPSNNISDAIRRYGVSDASTALLVIRIGPSDLIDVEGRMKAVVKGAMTPLDKIQDYTDWALVKKYHKLNAEPAIKVHAKDPIAEKLVVDNIVITAVAMKSVAQ